MMRHRIQLYGGKAIDAPGNHVLTACPFSREAAGRVAAIPKEHKSDNDELPEPRWMEFRFGLDFSDVTQRSYLNRKLTNIPWKYKLTLYKRPRRFFRLAGSEQTSNE